MSLSRRDGETHAIPGGFRKSEFDALKMLVGLCFFPHRSAFELLNVKLDKWKIARSKAG